MLSGTLEAPAKMVRQYLPYIVPLLLMGLVLRRVSRVRTINPSRMWIGSSIYALMAISGLVAGPFPSLLFLAIYVAAAFGGSGLGYLRANHQKLTIDPKTGKISSQPTTIGAVLVLALFAVRFGLKSAFPDLANHGRASSEITQGTSALLIFTVTMLIAQTAFLWLKTRPLLAAHAAGSKLPSEERV